MLPHFIAGGKYFDSQRETSHSLQKFLVLQVNMTAHRTSYAAVIDAGSTSSRLYIYQFQSEAAIGEPLSICQVFPSPSGEEEG